MQSSNKKQQAELSDDEISSEEEGEDLILEGVLIRNQEVASSSSSEEGSDDDDDDDDDDDGDDNSNNDHGNKEQEQTSSSSSSSSLSSSSLLEKRSKCDSFPAVTTSTCTCTYTTNTSSTYSIDRQDGDNGILTSELSPLIRCLSSSSSSSQLLTYLGGFDHTHTHARTQNADTCSNGNDNSYSYGYNYNYNYSSSNHDHTEAKGEVLHIQQRDTWSCGFRNLQMLLSAILPNVREHHPIQSLIQTITATATATVTATATSKSTRTSQTNCSNNNGNGNNIIILIPSIKQIQYIIEQSWEEGFDAQGKKYYQNKMVGKVGHKAKVGAVEISSILSYLHVDNTVVQFITCHESRSKLGPFVWSYFSRQQVHVQEGRQQQQQQQQQALFHLHLSNDNDHTNNNSMKKMSCYYCDGESICSSLDLAFNVLQSIPQDREQDRACNHPLLPLYLQWEGHSVSCIGIERIQPRNDGSDGYKNDKKKRKRQNESNYNYAYNLLIFCPTKSGATIKKSLSNLLSPISNNNNNNNNKSKSHIQHNVLRLSTTELLRKDCQMVVSSLKPLDDNIRRTRATMTNSNVITAAHDAVEQVMRQRKRWAR